jgi:hypothetical protein
VVSGSGTIVATASDNVAVTGVSFWSGNTKIGDGVRQSNGTWTVQLNSRVWPNGKYGIQSKAVDAAGNVGVSKQLTVTVRN